MHHANELLSFDSLGSHESRCLVEDDRPLLGEAFVSKASETVCLRRITLTLGPRRTHDLYDFYTPFPRSGIPREESRIHKARGAREKRGERRGEEGVFRRSSARKSGAFHTLFMKYIFQQNSSTTCTQPHSDKIDENVYI